MFDGDVPTGRNLLRCQVEKKDYASLDPEVFVLCVCVCTLYIKCWYSRFICKRTSRYWAFKISLYSKECGHLKMIPMLRSLNRAKIEYISIYSQSVHVKIDNVLTSNTCSHIIISLELKKKPARTKNLIW